MMIVVDIVLILVVVACIVFLIALGLGAFREAVNKLGEPKDKDKDKS